MMVGGKVNQAKWKTMQTLEEACQLVDMGVILKWREFTNLKKVLPEESQEQLMAHLATRLSERVSNRLSFEIALETLLVWLANSGNEKLMQVFVDALLKQPGWYECMWAITEVGLTSEVSDDEHDQDMFSMAVVLICELSLSVRELETDNAADTERMRALMDHVATYLLSVSNSSSTAIRLSLVHYFGVVELNQSVKVSFNKVMGRFGHTVLDSLFNLLFNKKSEAVALQYLQDNLPHVLLGDNHCQRVLHETMKFYMLKNPERFALFLATFAEYANSLPSEEFAVGRQTFVQHLGLLMKVASDFNHKDLVRDVLNALMKFDAESGRDAVIEQFANSAIMRRSLKDMVLGVRDALKANDNVEALAKLRTSKRGRKPSFSRVDRVATINQVAYLAKQELAKVG